MTDEEWYAADQPEILIRFLQDHRANPWPSAIFYAKNCLRLNWDQHNPLIKSTVESLEKEIHKRNEISIFDPIKSLMAFDVIGATTQIAVLSKVGPWLLTQQSTDASRVLGATPTLQAAILRNSFPPPGFQGPFQPSWRTVPVLDLCEMIEKNRDYQQLPILSDLLQEAGCQDQSIILDMQMPVYRGHGYWVSEGLLHPKPLKEIVHQQKEA